MNEHLKAKVRLFYDEAWNAGRVEVVDELFAETYIDHDATAHTGMDGRASAKAFVEVFRKGIPDFHLEIKDQISENQTVVTRWVATGTHHGTVLGIEATNNPIEVDGISIDRFDDSGRFAEGWGTWDGIRMLRQLGALPQAGDGT
jgi:steroid delta-isomerase-like uncharacterized protein